MNIEGLIAFDGMSICLSSFNQLLAKTISEKCILCTARNDAKLVFSAKYENNVIKIFALFLKLWRTCQERKGVFTKIVRLN